MKYKNKNIKRAGAVLAQDTSPDYYAAWRLAEPHLQLQLVCSLYRDTGCLHQQACHHINTILPPHPNICILPLNMPHCHLKQCRS